MKKFVSTRDFDGSGTGSDMPSDVAEAIAEVLSILDNCYGTNRTDAQLGGYVLLVEAASDVAEVEKILCEPMETAIAEIVDNLKSGYVRATYIINPDFSVTVLFPSYAVPSRLKEWEVEAMDKHKENVRDNGVCTVPQDMLQYPIEVVKMSEYDKNLFHKVYREISEQLGIEAALTIHQMFKGTQVKTANIC